ncbi:MAG: alkaline phosphatase D family protein [Actinomycetota bacterium]
MSNLLRRATVSLSAAVLLISAASAIRSAEEAPLQRFAFGSCAKQDQPQPIWDAIVEARPQLFAMIGDNIYADTADMAVMWRKYQLLGAQPGFQKLKATCPVVATWDDHDYGLNDGGVEFAQKRESQQLFLDFFGVPNSSPRRQQEGVYHAETYGPAGRRTQLILLDTRYFRTPLQKGFVKGEVGEGRRGIYAPDPDPQATILGEAQWKWLEAQLRVPADLRILASSVQVIPEEHGWEYWANFPADRARLFRLIRKTRAEGVVIISGDRHFAEISRLPAGKGGAEYPLYDVTSTSLNAPGGNMTKAGVRFANEINRHRVGLTYFDTNFGFIDVDWSQPSPLIRLQVRDEKGGVVLQQRLTLSELRRR